MWCRRTCLVTGLCGGAAFGLALVLLAACAQLPDVSTQLEAPRADMVAFEGTQGPVSAGRSAAILEHLEGGDGASDILARHLAHEQAFNLDSPLTLGNRVVLLEDGPATYAAMLAAISAARHHINLETYIIDDDEIGARFADLLVEKRSQGVEVNLIHDSLGTLTTPAAFFARLDAAGVRVLAFNPVNPLGGGGALGWSPNHRDHRKLLVVDGRIAFVGGINISKVYASDPFSRRVRRPPKGPTGWRDIHIQIEGPVVAEFQRQFVATWVSQAGPALDHTSFFPTLTPAGDEIVRAVGYRAGDPQSPVYLTLLSAISHAEHSVQLTVAYFAPDPQLLTALSEAVARGVSVSMVVPSYSDSWAIFHLGRSYYAELLRAGVHIYERRGALMHSKTASIDGVWSTIGSSNLDPRSFLHNDELNAVILSREFAVRMDAMFASDLAESEPIDLASWRRRALGSRFKEWLARFAAHWL